MEDHLTEKLEKYTTGTGQKILVHNKETCKGQYCCIHNPSDHHMKDWPTHWRDDRGFMERMCSHGVGHPDPDDLAFKYAMAKKFGRGDVTFESVHGCDGCCSDFFKGEKYEVQD